MAQVIFWILIGALYTPIIVATVLALIEALK